MRIDYGPMRKHEENAILYNDIYTTPERPYAEAEAEANNDEGKGKVIDLVIPVIILIVFCIAGIMYSGGFFHGETDLLTPSPTVTRHRDCLLEAPSLIVIVIYYLIRKNISFKDQMDCIPEGFKAMVAAT